MRPLRLPDGPGSRLGAFDRRMDEVVEHLWRGRPGVDRLMYAASALGDHGLVWMLLACLQAARHGDREWRRPLLRAVLGLGAESVLVNGPIKWMFRRERPAHDGPRPLHLRSPRTSSFPSGHASAAFFGAALLRDEDRWWPAYYLMAVVVATSRLHVRIHHASDVVGGAVVGALLGEAVRWVLPARQPLNDAGPPLLDPPGPAPGDTGSGIARPLCSLLLV